MNNKLLSHSNTITAPKPEKKKSSKIKTLFAATMALGAAAFATIGGEKNPQSSQNTEGDNEAAITYVQRSSNKFVENKDATQFLNACPWCGHIPKNSPLWNLDNLPDDATWNKLSDSQKKEFLVYANIVSATLFNAGNVSSRATKVGVQAGTQKCTEIALLLLEGPQTYESSISPEKLDKANNLIYRAQLWGKVGQALENAEGSVLGSYKATMSMKGMEIKKFLESKGAKMGGIELDDLLKENSWAVQTLSTPKQIDFPSVIKNAQKTAPNNVAYNKTMMDKAQNGG